MAENDKDEEEGTGKPVETFLGSLTLGAVFRHFLSGAVFIAAFLYSRGNFRTAAGLAILKEYSLVVGLWTLVCGALIYSLHRGITNPICEVVRQWLLNKRPRLRGFFMPSHVKDLMLKRWNYIEDIKARANNIYTWGDYVHLLYTAALAVSLGSISAYVLASDKPDWRFSSELFIVILLLAWAGFYTDCRKQIVEEELYQPAIPGDYQI